MKISVRTIAAAIIASSTFAGIAGAAEGDYYEGVSRNSAGATGSIVTDNASERSFGFPALGAERRDRDVPQMKRGERSGQNSGASRSN